MNNFTAGRLKLFSQNWRKITSDTIILDMVANGCQIKFDKPIPWHLARYQSFFNTKETLEITTEITKLASFGVIKQVQDDAPGFFSQIFTTPKKDGSIRLILNLKNLNESIEYQHFKMDSFISAVTLVTKNCYMASIDLRHAYYSVAVHVRDQHLLQFKFKGKTFQFTCLPNGLSSCPRDFTKICKPIFATLRNLGVSIVGYIDDSFIQADSYDDCINNVKLTANLFESLGFIIHPVKSVFEPTQQLTFLGFIINSQNMTIKVTASKKETIRKSCLSLLSKSHAIIRSVARVIGMLVAASPGVLHANLYIKCIEIEKIQALSQNKGNYEALMPITESMKECLSWWSTNIDSQEKPISHNDPNTTMYTDASNLGWGAVLDGVQANGTWTTSEQSLHINCLEILAIYHGLRAICKNVENIHIRVMTDNTTAYYYVNNMGGTQSPKANELTRLIWLWCSQKRIWLSAGYIPGKLNTEADRLSRHFNTNAEFKLSPKAFNTICITWGTPEIDLFATRTNAQLSRFVSQYPDPDAYHINALSMNWENLRFYAFPPFCIIGKCIQKIIFDRAEGIIVAPYWPTQCWFSQLTHHIIETPLMFKPSKTLLINQISNEPHPLHKKLRLISCRISYDITKIKAFQAGLPRYYYNPGAQQPDDSMQSTLISGRHTVVKGKLITFKLT